MKQKKEKLKIEKIKIARLNNLISIQGGTGVNDGGSQTKDKKDENSSVPCFLTINQQ